MTRFDTISFLSDYGTEDEFVGVVKSVIRSIAPDVAVIDLTHAIAPHDIRAGGLALARSAQYLNPGVVVAVVDPGVGTDRRGVVVEVGGGTSLLVGPDNGLLAPAVALCGGATAAAVLDNTEYHLPAPGQTFDGRDVFAPVAANLCLGAELSDVGTVIDPAELLPSTLPVAEPDPDGRIVGEVLWVDRFGNCQLNVEPELLEPLGVDLLVTTNGKTRTVSIGSSFRDLPSGRPGLVIDSYGMLALAVERSSAAVELGLAAGDEVKIEAGDQSRVAAPDPARVEIRPKRSPTGAPEGAE